MMKFLIDKGILHAESAFSTIGEVRLEVGSEITPQKVKDIDALVLRTTTKVDRALIEGSNVKFVATATSGSDHVDKDYLCEQNIGFAAAPGCNAEAVGEFVVNALIRLAHLKSFELEGKTLGIIGAGNTGSALASKANVIGMNCLLNDPPLYDQSKDPTYVPLKTLLETSDIISLHVPLIRDGKYKTHHLIDAECIKLMKKGIIIINACRGGVIKESDLLENKSLFGGAILDVWENEPSLNMETLDFADFATPHIAGYSLEGKIKATEMAYANTCSFFGLTPTWISPRNNEGDLKTITIDSVEHKKVILEAIEKIYDISEDDKELRQYQKQASSQQFFRDLRRNYKFRREFASSVLILNNKVSKETVGLLQKLGFQIDNIDEYWH